MTEEELKDAEKKRDEALAVTFKANEESQRIDKENAERTAFGREIAASNTSLEKENTKLISDIQGLIEERNAVCAELEEDKAELKKVKDVLETITLKRDEENTRFNQEIIQHVARMTAMDLEYSTQKESHENELRDLTNILVSVEDKIVFKESELSALEDKVKDEKSILANTQKRINQLEADGRTLIDANAQAEKNLVKLNAQITESASEIDSVNTEISIKRSELAQVSSEYESKKNELFSISDARRRIDEREQIVKDRYKEAGLPYPEN